MLLSVACGPHKTWTAATACYDTKYTSRIISVNVCGGGGQSEVFSETDSSVIDDSVSFYASHQFDL